MAAQYTVYTAGDRFVTMAEDGEAHIWTVTPSDIPEKVN